MINQDDFEILDPLPKPPNIWAEILLVFDCDLPVEPLSDLIHLPVAAARCRLNTRINPITHTRNPGYWSYKTPKKRTFEDELMSCRLTSLSAVVCMSMLMVISFYGANTSSLHWGLREHTVL